MNVSEAIELLAPYHTAKVVCATRFGGTITGQLSTGNADYPFIDVIDSMVDAQAVYTAIELHEANTNGLHVVDISFC